MKWTETYGLGLTVIGLIGILSTFFTIVIVIVYRDRRVIKGSTRELLAISLIGMIMAFATMGSFITKASNITCLLNRNGFHLSVSLIFSPLLLKMYRVYAIFKASGKFSKAKGVSTGIIVSQCISCIAIQVGIYTFD